MTTTPFFRLLLTILLTAGLGLTLAACDSSGDNDDDGPQFSNEFSFEITESTTTAATKQIATLDGFSFFFGGEDPETGDQAFIIYFTGEDELNGSSANQGLFGFAVRETLRPGTGIYPLISLDDENPTTNFGMVLLESVGDSGTGSGSFTSYVADGGTIQLTTSSDDRVVGRVSAQAMRTTVDGSTTDMTRVTIDGQFAAENADSFVGFQGFTP